METVQHIMLSYEALNIIFLNVLNGVGNHSSFVCNFSRCWVSADAENRRLLKDAAEEIANKYSLYTGEYLRIH